MQSAERYDIIGDIHGHAEPLERIFGRLGYTVRGGIYRAPTGRRAIFLGDFINRGPAIPRVLEIVRGMVQHGGAWAVMGNHEFNALACGADGMQQPWEPETRVAFQDAPAAWADHLGCFATLPLYLDLGGLRIVHACWNEAAVKDLGGALFTPDLLRAKGTPPTARQAAADLLLRGPEIHLPRGITVPGPRGPREKVRLKWWDQSAPRTFAALGLSPAALPDAAIPEEQRGLVGGYEVGAPPLFFGHYGYPKPARPFLQNAACLDLAVAHGGPLCAYRWEGECELRAEHYIVQPPERRRATAGDSPRWKK